ncbi:class I SAM-dependent methyltransferase [Mycolicibacterium komossense]|uniref:Class I SAM-dependent methyltransferase n=1 Tax=Mycolicibacterium komossense TaxID=1779 RepID=A0ABT3C760_9MYCO|nr:class I SAM-dependent methyltransferase [Mycolicibacterium komossense]MCV7225266.1 class I SAM-dependent methyltransferase [Mycolicibacterium komossense]
MTEQQHTDESPLAASRLDPGTYHVCFEGIRPFALVDRPDTFRVSQAGLALGNYLRDNLGPGELAGRILDVGTGSGAIAMLIRELGASSITATDICGRAVASARENEVANFDTPAIDYSCCDLFPKSDIDSKFDLVVFNPPGWREPPKDFTSGEVAISRQLHLDAMFNGHSVIQRFLQKLPERLAAGGRAIVGFNSLVGIEDVLAAARTALTQSTGARIHTQVLARVELPLMLYTSEWTHALGALLSSFEHGRSEYAATYLQTNDTIHWFYEITEITFDHTGDGERIGAASALPAEQVVPQQVTRS